MSMVVKNNMAADIALHYNTEHKDAMSKALDMVSTGQKLNSAKDDASSYAISERMRDLLRGLDQSKINAQNGSALLNTAAAGIDNIISELRSLNELTISAQNDTNTDNDRATMQKEFDQRVATINDIVFNTQYNGLTLLGGEYGVRVEGEIEPVQGYDGKLTTSFKAYSNTEEGAAYRTSRCTGADGNYLVGEVGFKGASSFSVEINFDGMDFGSNPAKSLDGRGFIILCGGCSQYLNVKFDGNKDSADSTYDSNPSTTNNLAREYVIGIKGVQNGDDLAKAIFDGIVASRGDDPSTATSRQIDSSHNVTINKTNDGKYTISKAANLSMSFLTGVVDASGQVVDDAPDSDDPEEPWDPKIYSPLKIHYGTKAGDSVSIFINDLSTRRLKTRVIYEDDVAKLESLLNDKQEYDNYKEYLKSTKGVLAQDIENLERYRDNKELYETYKEILKAARKQTLDDSTLKTLQEARVTQRVVEGALNYALNESTSVGAYSQRLQYASERLNTMSENVQSAESVIRDSDMAESFTNFTKSSMLARSSEAMLAQANQSSSDVLGLVS